jgi:hypothetical protein
MFRPQTIKTEALFFDYPPSFFDKSDGTLHNWMIRTAKDTREPKRRFCIGDSIEHAGSLFGTLLTRGLISW